MSCQRGRVYDQDEGALDFEAEPGRVGPIKQTRILSPLAQIWAVNMGIIGERPMSTRTLVMVMLLGLGLVLQKDRFVTKIVTNPEIKVYAFYLTMSSLNTNKKDHVTSMGGIFIHGTSVLIIN